MKKLAGFVTALVVAGGLVLSAIPHHAEARGGFSSSRSSFSSSRSSFGSSSSRSSFSGSSSRSSSSGRSFFGRTSSSSSKPKVSLTKSSSTTKKSSFFGGASTKSKPKTAITTKKSSFSGKTSTVKKSTVSKSSTGSFSGRTSTVRGRTYTSSRVTHSYVGGHYVSVNHYYGVGYSPYSWYGYYDGFTTGMFMSSLYHPWGGTYYVNGTYTGYSGSPIAWVVDFAVILIILWLIVWACVTFSPSRKTYVRRF